MYDFAKSDSQLCKILKIRLLTIIAHYSPAHFQNGIIQRPLAIQLVYVIKNTQLLPKTLQYNEK